MAPHPKTTALLRPSAAVPRRASSSSGTLPSSPSSTVPSAGACAAEAILTSGREPVTADMLRRLPEVCLVVTTSVGLDHIDVSECRRRGIVIASAGDVYSEDVADLAVGLLINVLRKVSASDRHVRRGLWSSEVEFALGAKLEGKESWNCRIGKDWPR